MNRDDFHGFVQWKLLIGLDDLLKLGENVFRGLTFGWHEWKMNGFV